MAPKRKSKAGTSAQSSRPKRSKPAADSGVDLPFDAEWGGVGEVTSKGLYPLMVLTGSGIKGSSKLAGFDIDSTLIVPKSGRKFGTGPSDWMLMKNVKEKLTSIHKDGFKVVFFTNQRGLEKGYSTPKDFQKKVTAIINELDIPIQDKDLIIMVGPPASGKSCFSHRYLVPHGYVRVNRDTLRTPAKCLAATKTAIKEGKNVVIDNTNPSVSARANYIKAAKNASYKIRCFNVTTPLDLAHHLNYVRQAQTESKVRRVPDVGYNVYKKNYQKPEKEEGFNDILEIPFVPNFDNDKDKTVFLQWMDG